MRAERLLRLLAVLQAERKVTAPDLAGRLGVSARTVQRDLDALSLAGVPVYATRGRGGGWTLLPGYRTRLNSLTPAEAMTFFVGSTAHVLADLGLDAASASAADKLLGALPPGVRGDADSVRRRVLVDHVGWEGMERAGASGSAALAACRRGVWEERILRIGYRSAADWFAVEPLGLVAKGRTWYLVARRGAGSPVRTYRVGRIRSAEVTGTRFERPAGFDLEAYWEKSCRAFVESRPERPVRLRMRGAALRRLAWATSILVTAANPADDGEPAGPKPWHRSGSGADLFAEGGAFADGEATEGDDRWWLVDLLVEEDDQVLRILLGMGGDVAVLDPPALRARVRDGAQALVRLHTDVP